MPRTVLAGDIGATKTTLALYGDAPHPLQEHTYQNKQYSSFNEIIRHFINLLDVAPHCACLGIAGPVRKNRVQMTNLDWTIDGQHLCSLLGASQVLLVNDLVATSAGALSLPESSMMTINPGTPDPSGARAVLAAGTGLGEAFVIQTSSETHIMPSEGGHSSFSPRNTEQLQLLKWLLSSQQSVSVEQVCSGRAIGLLYQFVNNHLSPQPQWMDNSLSACSEPAPVIVAAAIASLKGDKKCTTAELAIQLFVDILAAESANLALKVLATGGVYIGGGLMPRILPCIQPQRFLDIFCHGVYKDMLHAIPIHILLDPQTALIGSCKLARQETTRFTSIFSLKGKKR